MSTSSSRTHGSDGQYADRTTPIPSVSRYDFVLALIPTAFLLTVVVAGLADVAVPKALAAGSVVALTAVVDALFLNPPTGG
ncbi:hypothetical protein EGH21_22215 [Halomicroarcula sp. F13]|uniref:Uncharacterized protein n=1 Tax=Haloarcula rubra TaxID=2487747 RepID=A0AAW4PWS0_9EURY|nr:hypothetical protein [Halomicroarcula rubra]MBX0325735.1 hypothetical protein [Halomicroarcula rubra]